MQKNHLFNGSFLFVDRAKNGRLVSNETWFSYPLVYLLF